MKINSPNNELLDLMSCKPLLVLNAPLLGIKYISPLLKF